MGKSLVNSKIILDRTPEWVSGGILEEILGKCQSEIFEGITAVFKGIVWGWESL